jgi:antitoxin PrlF
MPVARVTSKGQITIPRSVRDALGIEPGDRIAFEVGLGGARISKQASLVDLRETVPVPEELRGRRWEEVRSVAASRRVEDWEAKAQRLAD